MPILCTYLYLLNFFNIISGNRDRIRCLLGFFQKRKMFSPKRRWKEDATTAPHTTPQLFDLDWMESWQSGSVKQFYLLTSCKLLMTLEILEVCFDNEVNNCINVIHCKLVRKQVRTDKRQTPVSLQTVGFFGTVRRINRVPVMSSIYSNSAVPIRSVAKLCCREKNGAALQKDIQDCITLAPCSY